MQHVSKLGLVALLGWLSFSGFALGAANRIYVVTADLDEDLDRQLNTIPSLDLRLEEASAKGYIVERVAKVQVATLYRVLHDRNTKLVIYMGHAWGFVTTAAAIPAYVGDRLVAIDEVAVSMAQKISDIKPVRNRRKVPFLSCTCLGDACETSYDALKVSPESVWSWRDEIDLRHIESAFSPNGNFGKLLIGLPVVKREASATSLIEVNEADRQDVEFRLARKEVANNLTYQEIATLLAYDIISSSSTKLNLLENGVGAAATVEEVLFLLDLPAVRRQRGLIDAAILANLEELANFEQTHVSLAEMAARMDDVGAVEQVLRKAIEQVATVQDVFELLQAIKETSEELRNQSISGLLSKLLLTPNAINRNVKMTSNERNSVQAEIEKTNISPCWSIKGLLRMLRGG